MNDSGISNLTIRTLGNTEVLLDGQAVQWRAESARNLFFYLLSNPQGKRREEIINALWDLEACPTVSNRLRVTVHRARLALGSKDAILEEHNRYRLAPFVLEATDTNTFYAGLDWAKRATPANRIIELKNALKSYQGHYLPLETTDWAKEARDQHRNAYVRAEIELSGLYCAAGACHLSSKALARALRADPFVGENHHQKLMSCLSASEGKFAAIEHYRRYLAFLLHELDDTPMRETIALAQRIKNGERICACAKQQAQVLEAFKAPIMQQPIMIAIPN